MTELVIVYAGSSNQRTDSYYSTRHTILGEQKTITVKGNANNAWQLYTAANVLPYVISYEINDLKGMIQATVNNQ